MVSEPLDEGELNRALTGRRFARVTVVAETGSTNDDLRAAAASGGADGTVILAEHQLAGKGRAGRGWESEPGLGLLLSALIVPGPAAAAPPLLSLAAGLAVADATAPFGTRLKWPNDLMLHGAKAGGVLVEGEVSGSEWAFAVVGIGLNVNHGDGQLPYEATSLAREAGGPVDRGRLAVALLIALEERIGELARPATLLSAYRERCITLGCEVRVVRRDGTITGIALDIDERGALVVASDRGIETVSFGDVVHLRTAGGGRG